MKFLTALVFGVLFNGFLNPTSPEINYPATTSVEEEYCKLTLSGYANLNGMRVKMTFVAEAETCDQAADEMREEIIEREIRIDY